MIQSISLLISFILECTIFIYYTNSVFQCRKSYLWSNMCIILGYLVLYIISLYYIPSINMTAFLIINSILIYLCFQTKLKNAVIQAFILSAIMMLSEGVVFMFTNIGVYRNSLLDVSLSARILHAIFSKLIYFIGVVVDKYISNSKFKNETSDGYFSLMIIPIFTMMSIMGVMSVFEYINEEQRLLFAFILIIGMAANIMAYWIYDKTLIYHREIRELQEQKYKNNLELTYCNMLTEKLSQANIMRHDFKEHLRILEAYINSDDIKARDYIKSINIYNDEISIINYTKNKVLNILFSEKQKICINKGIDFKIHASDIELGFIQDIDIVSIFSNLLNNAIESCDKSERKIIYVNIYKMNSSFLVIKIDNSCDEKPVEENGFYKTTKISRGEHGIGLNSVVKTVKKYKGDLRMEYDSENKIFSSVIMIPIEK